MVILDHVLLFHGVVSVSKGGSRKIVQSINLITSLILGMLTFFGTVTPSMLRKVAACPFHEGSKLISGFVRSRGSTN